MRLLVLVCVFSAVLHAEGVPNVNGWFNYFGEYGLGNGWSWWTEFQARRNEAIAEPQQYLVRTSLLKQIRPGLKAGAGYGFIRTYRYGKAPVAADFDENRLYQDLLWDQTRGVTRLSHRFRWEERWIGPTHRYQHRFRYRLMIRRPIAGSKHWYWTAGDEIMFNIAPNKPPKAFDQNRLMALLGHSFTSGWRVEAGFMEHTLQQRNGRVLEHNHTLMFQVFAPPWKLRK